MARKIGPCLLMILTAVWITNGLSTKKCDHNQLANHVKQLTSCLNSELSALMDQLLEDYKVQVRENNNSYDLKKGCPAIQTHADKIAKCAVSVTSSCLDDKTTDIVKHYFNYAGIICRNLEYLIIRQGNVSPVPEELRTWFDGLQKQIERWGGRNQFDVVTNLVKPDKKCDGRKFHSAIRKMSTCFETASETLTKPFEKLSRCLSLR